MIVQYVSQAECRIVAGDTAAVLTTVLGSCVACCIWDARAQVGGMNHFLLPGTEGENLAALSAGSASMEMLINECLKAGASRGELRARLFGGASVVRRLGNVGARNADFARCFLAAEGIALASSSLGGDRARRIRFWPATGKAQQRRVDQVPIEKPFCFPFSGTVELF